jgi:hypothetical protein
VSQNAQERPKPRYGTSIKSIYEANEFCVKWKRDEVTQPIPQATGVRQVCSLSPYLFNIFTDDTVDNIKERNRRSPVAEELMIPCLLFTDKVAAGSFTIN